MVRIMIADDYAATRLFLRDVLTFGHHEVVAEASDGLEAIEKFYQTNPDLLLLDLAMPKKDGLAVLRQIMKTNPDAKVIVTTAIDSPKAIGKCLEAGAITYFMKPFDSKELLKAIELTLAG